MPLRRAVPWVLVALVLAVYAQVRGHEFLDYDDVPLVLHNPIVEPGLSFAGLVRAFSGVQLANWVPLTWISYQLDRTLWGEAPAGYHLANVALHAGAAVLLYLALARMTRAPAPAAYVAAVFAVHPLHVESVAWVAERRDVLCGFWWMATLLAYARYAERPASRGRYAAVVGATGAALLAKPLAVTLPATLLLLDAWPLGRLAAGPDRWARFRRACVEKLPLFAMSAGVAAVTWSVRRPGRGVWAQQPPLGRRVANAVVAYASYLGDAVWPSGLAAIYPLGREGPSALAVVGAVALLLAASVAVLRSAPRRPWLLVGWLWYLGTLLPMIGLVQAGMHSRADRYTYVPLVGISIAVAWSAAEWAAGRPRRRAAVAGIAAASIAALAALAYRQVPIWHDTLALFGRAVEVTRDNYVAQYRLGAALERAGRIDEAIARYRESVRIEPGLVDGHFALARALDLRADSDGAIAARRAGLALEFDRPAERGRLGLALVATGRHGEAVDELERSLAEEPGSARLHAALAVALRGVGRPEDAIRHDREALRLDPGLVLAANNLAWALATCERADLRQPDEAVTLAEAAVRGAPAEHPTLLDTLGAAYASAGRFEEATRSAARAAELASAAGDVALADEIAARHALYRSGRSYFEPPVSPR